MLPRDAKDVRDKTGITDTKRETSKGRPFHIISITVVILKYCDDAERITAFRMPIRHTFGVVHPKSFVVITCQSYFGFLY